MAGIDPSPNGLPRLKVATIPEGIDALGDRTSSARSIGSRRTGTRGKGIARALIAAVEAWVRRQGCFMRYMIQL